MNMFGVFLYSLQTIILVGLGKHCVRSWQVCAARMWSLANQTYNKLETQASGFMLNLLSNVPINTSTLYHICTADAQPHSLAIHTFFLVLEAFLHSVWSWIVKTNISWIVFEGLIWPEGNIAICGHKNNLTQIHYPPSHSQKELQIHCWVSVEVQTHKMLTFILVIL